MGGNKCFYVTSKYIIKPQLLITREVGIVCPPSVEVFTSQCYQNVLYCACVEETHFCPGCHLSPWALPGENSALQYLTLRFLAHQQKDLFFHLNAVHLFGQSLLLLSMCFCLCLIFILFPLKSKVLMMLDFCSFAHFSAKSISCVPMVVILYGRVCISTFKHIWNHWFYTEFNETEGFVVL